MYHIVNRIPFEKKSNYSLRSLHDVTILIKTLERMEHLVQLLNSIKQLGFKGPVIIADDSKQPYRNEILKRFPELLITYLILPYDAGTAEGRNQMLSHTNTSYFVLCDDDFVFEPRTRLPLMRQMLIENNLDILAGVFIQNNLKSRKGRFKFSLSKQLLKMGLLFPADEIYEYMAHFNINENKCSISKVSYSSPLTRCDLVHNFFIANTESVKKIGGWNAELKGGEHQNFFIRAKLHHLKVATTRLCGVVHNRWTLNSREYASLRNRGQEFQKIALKEFGFETIYGFKEVMGEKFA